MTVPLERLIWEAPSVRDALDALILHSGLAERAALTPLVSLPAPRDAESFERWLQDVAAFRGVETEHVESSYAELEGLLRGSAPALLRIPGLPLEDDAPAWDTPGLVAVVGAGRKVVRLLAPDLTVRDVPFAVLLEAFCGKMLEQEWLSIDRLLAESGIGPARRPNVREHLLRERFGEVRIGGCFLLHEAPHRSFVRLAQRTLKQPMAVLMGSHFIEYVLWVGAWWLLGQGVLEGNLDRGWLWAWALLLVANVPFRMLGASAGAKLSISFGQLLKQRLLHGAFQISPDTLRAEGAGMLLGRVLEAEAIEGLALGGGLQALVFVIEFGVTLVVLALGPSAWLLVLLFLLWLGLIGAVSVAYWGALSAWTGKRLALTHDLVEKMAGHRTRRSQEPFESAHEGEDEALEAYLQGSGELDRWTVRLSTLLPGTFLVVGLLALSVAFVEGPTQTELAVMLGGILMAHGTLWRLLGAATSLGRAFVAWHKVGPLLEAARRAPPLGSPLFASGKSVRSGSPSTIVLDAVGISVRYAGRHGASLRDCSLRIRHGDRVLLTGPSGSGKSTLVSTLAGLRAPESGLVLLHGLDHHAVAQSTWRRSVVLTPQFHENHVIGGSFAFNLFMGSQWPVTPAALARAEDLCKELGLGDLLERMPGGMLQVVGETGWQMSHGERSRLFIARAILQQPEVLILDESFGALDPENMRRALDCVDRHARTMVVIDHP